MKNMCSSKCFNFASLLALSLLVGGIGQESEAQPRDPSPCGGPVEHQDTYIIEICLPGECAPEGNLPPQIIGGTSWQLFNMPCETCPATGVACERIFPELPPIMIPPDLSKVFCLSDNGRACYKAIMDKGGILSSCSPCPRPGKIQQADEY